MSVKISILNATGAFNDIYQQLEDEGCRAVRLIAELVSLAPVDITLSPSSADDAPLGIAGFVISPCRIEIMLDSSRDDIVEVVKQDLAAVIAHEVHHLVRASSGIESKTLLQHIVAEGLACHFETQVNGNTLPSLFDEIKHLDWWQLYQNMRPQLNSTEFSYPLYFGGEDEAKFPNRAAYWVGFNLVAHYINQYGGCAVSLAAAPAEQLVACCLDETVLGNYVHSKKS